MGSSLAPIIADLVLEELFDNSIPKFPTQPIFIKKYVDDVICAIKGSEVDAILNILNSFHNDLKFTVEIEADNRINFLDTTLIRTNNTITTDWYRKSLSSDRILNFLSAHPYQMKFNVALSFAKRVLSLSDKSFHNQNMNTIKQVLTLNNYPEPIINKIIHKININTNSQITPTVETETNNKMFTSMHYVPSLTESLSKKIGEKINKKFAYKPIKTLRKHLFTNTKAKIDNENKSGIIYQIPCGSCDAIYVGETSKKLSTRKRQHLNDYKNISYPTGKTSLINHTLETSHKFNYDGMQILDFETNRKKREMLESTYILALSPRSINRKTDTNNISDQFLPVISTYTSTSILSPLRPKQNSNQQTRNNQNN